MIRLTFANYEELMHDGITVMFDGRYGKAEADDRWNGGYRVGGRSIKTILEDFNEVFVVLNFGG